MMELKSFPVKLYLILDCEDPEIVRWVRNGFAFKVFDSKRFQDEILPKYYRHHKVESFQRQLNLYGFKRVHKGEDMGAYYHPLLVQGQKDWANRFTKELYNNSYYAEAMRFVAQHSPLYSEENKEDQLNNKTNLHGGVETRRKSSYALRGAKPAANYRHSNAALPYRNPILFEPTATDPTAPLSLTSKVLLANMEYSSLFPESSNAMVVVELKHDDQDFDNFFTNVTNLIPLDDESWDTNSYASMSDSELMELLQ